VNKKFIKPFSKDEIERILKVFKERKENYLGFVKFLFITGCRFGEATGLTWDKVDFEEDHVLISESLSKDPRGSYKKIQKERKNGGFILFPMDVDLREILKNQPRINDYVFLTVRGKNIDPVAFRNQYWQPYLEEAGVPFRSPHKTRHTFASVAIKQGIPLTDVACLMGDTVPTVMKNYSHFIGSVRTPKIF
jgi:integrase